MAKWSKTKVNENEINNGNEYSRIDRPTRQQLNAIVNNSLYATEKSEYASQISENVAEQLSNLGTNDKIEFKGSNPNLLINGDFSVNQRGQQSYSEGTTIDGYTQTNVTTTINDDHSITLTNFLNYGRLIQNLKDFENLKGKTVTLSVKFRNVSYTNSSDPRLVISDGVSTGLSNTISNAFNGIYTFTRTLSSNATKLEVRPIHNHLNTTDSDLSVTIEWVKLEIGSVATTFSPKPYEEELASCQVISGGIATTYSNPNLLINGDFRVNQRGESSYSGVVKYTVDRWILGSGVSFLNYDATNKQIESIGVSGISSTGTPRIILRQFVEDWQKFIGKTLTVSMKYENFTEDVVGTTMLTIYDGKGRTDIPLSSVGESGIVAGTRTIREDATLVIAEIRITGSGKNATLKPKWVKLEVGDIATAFSPRPYAEELAMCQRYYVKFANTGGTPIVANTYAYTSTNIGFVIKTNLRTSPSIGYSGVEYRSISEDILRNIALSFTAFTNGYVTINSTTPTKAVAGENGLIRLTGTNSYIELDAEIY